ncbi:arsenic transporter [Corynebacterium hylobatis]|uniref:Arsenic transporter n=1 Tax=Corynebacterium hylobatis TaxID=1859290 RepID=A0A430HW64_9CORY|nr:SLC13 family permease [Corynebacterium hylobatis]RSZ61823.1 arsenic transporter [Corynebacterium hylobatis]
MRTPVLALTSALGLITLLLIDAPSVPTLLSRILPVLSFVAAMSVVVAAAGAVSTFEAVIGKVQAVLGLGGSAPGRGSSARAWALILGVSLVITVFFSLDTTAILATPLVITLARGVGINPLAAAFAVIWMANLGSLLLPISNLTNLLAVQTDAFSRVADYVAVSWLPALVLVVVAVVAPLVVARFAGVPAAVSAGDGSAGGVGLDREAKVFTALIGVLLVALLMPVDVWISTTIAALVALGLLHHWSLPTPVHHMIPWATLLFAFSLTTSAAIIHSLGLLDPVLSTLSDSGLFTLAFAGVALSNLINNIPAYLALEPAASSPESFMALLIGVNAGPIITPWASLATLLWAHQARQQGVQVSWGMFVLGGLVLAPVAVGAGVGVLGLSNG